MTVHHFPLRRTEHSESDAWRDDRDDEQKLRFLDNRTLRSYGQQSLVSLSLLCCHFGPSISHMPICHPSPSKVLALVYGGLVVYIDKHEGNRDTADKGPSFSSEAQKQEGKDQYMPLLSTNQPHFHKVIPKKSVSQD